LGEGFFLTSLAPIPTPSEGQRYQCGGPDPSGKGLTALFNLQKEFQPDYGNPDQDKD
jgi:hypothetical protein